MFGDVSGWEDVWDDFFGLLIFVLLTIIFYRPHRVFAYNFIKASFSNKAYFGNPRIFYCTIKVQLFSVVLLEFPLKWERPYDLLSDWNCKVADFWNSNFGFIHRIVRKVDTSILRFVGNKIFFSCMVGRLNSLRRKYSLCLFKMFMISCKMVMRKEQRF